MAIYSEDEDPNVTQWENDKHVWEGWTVQDFIDDLDIIFKYQEFKTKKEVREWCKDNQPYYKKHIPEVANHFINKAKL